MRETIKEKSAISIEEMEKKITEVRNSFGEASRLIEQSVSEEDEKGNFREIGIYLCQHCGKPVGFFRYYEAEKERNNSENLSIIRGFSEFWFRCPHCGDLIQ